MCRCRLAQQTDDEIGIGGNLQQRRQTTDALIHQAADRFGAFRGRQLAADHDLEVGVVDHRSQRIEKLLLQLGELATHAGDTAGGRASAELGQLEKGFALGEETTVRKGQVFKTGRHVSQGLPFLTFRKDGEAFGKALEIGHQLLPFRNKLGFGDDAGRLQDDAAGMICPNEHFERAAELGDLVGHQSGNGTAGAARCLLAGHDEFELGIVDGRDQDFEEPNVKRFQFSQSRLALLP